MKVWSKLWHPNVVEFVGYLTGEAGAPILVSRWMENGTALDYVKKHPDADISSLVCILPYPCASLLMPGQRFSELHRVLYTYTIAMSCTQI